MGLNINLLPAEFRVDQKSQKKFQIVQKISIAILLVLVFLASGATAFRIFQSQDITKIEDQAKQGEQRVVAKKTSEATLVVLKNRLTLINQIQKSSSNNTLVYQRISGLIPPDVTTSSLSVDRSGNMLLSIIAPNTQSLEGMLNNLTSKEAFDAISSIELQSLSRGRDGVFRSSLKITANKSK